MIKLHIYAIIFVLLGAINTTTNLFDINFIKSLGDNTNKLVSTLIYILVGLSIVYIMFDRDTYLPFLGQTVFPCDVLATKTPEDSNYSIEIKTLPNTKIVYWGAEPSDNTNKDYKQAYKGYKNSGITVSDDKGIAKIQLKRPSGYNVPFKKLNAHIHYRECINMNMLDEVKTIFI